MTFKSGKITSKYPYDFTKEFNWGAFFGTWIWGLINKSYITLLYLILWFTPLGFNFALYCGLKGNEWAYKNKKCSDIDEFNDSQKSQSVIFAVISVIILPLICLLIKVLLVLALFLSQSNAAANEPKKDKKAGVEKSVEQSVENLLATSVDMYFERYIIEPKINRFYVKSEMWSASDYKTRKEMLDIAASFVAEKHKTTRTKELSKTRIYSSKNNKLLAEYEFDDSLFDSDKLSYKEIFSAAAKAYKFYEVK